MSTGVELHASIQPCQILCIVVKKQYVLQPGSLIMQLVDDDSSMSFFILFHWCRMAAADALQGGAAQLQSLFSS